MWRLEGLPLSSLVKADEGHSVFWCKVSHFSAVIGRHVSHKLGGNEHPSNTFHRMQVSKLLLCHFTVKNKKIYKQKNLSALKVVLPLQLFTTIFILKLLPVCLYPCHVLPAQDFLLRLISVLSNFQM